MQLEKLKYLCPMPLDRILTGLCKGNNPGAQLIFFDAFWLREIAAGLKISNIIDVSLYVMLVTRSHFGVFELSKQAVIIAFRENTEYSWIVLNLLNAGSPLYSKYCCSLFNLNILFGKSSIILKDYECIYASLTESEYHKVQ